MNPVRKAQSNLTAERNSAKTPSAGLSNGVKVLIAAPLYPPEIGGPATHAVLVERELPSRGHTVETLPFSRVRHLPRVVRHAVYALILWRRARYADVIYVLDPVSVGLPAYVAALLSGTPYVLRIGGDYAWEQGVQRFGIEETLDAFLLRKTYPFVVDLLRTVQSRVARRARALVAPSNYLAGVATHWGVDRSHIVVAYSAPEAMPQHTRAEARRMLGIHEDVFLVVSAGRLVPWKGYEALIEGFSMATRNMPQAKLVIAGDGPERGTLMDMLHRLSLSGKVHLIGSVPRERLATWLASADCFVLNTRYEGLSHQIMEALMMHTPVVTTSAGGNAELIEDGESGLIVPFNDAEKISQALTRLQNDRTLCDTLRQGGTQKLLQFDTKTAIDTIVETLTSATNA